MNPAIWREFETACICCAFQDAWDIAEGEGRERTLALFTIHRGEARLAWFLLENPGVLYRKTHDQLGLQVGFSRESVTRVMQRWRNMKIVNGRVLDRAALQRRFDELERRT